MWCPHAILRIIFAYILYKNVGRPLLNIRNLSPGDSRCFIRICLLFSSASMKHGSTKLISPRCHSCEGFYFIKGIILESSNSAPSLFQSLLHGLLSSTSSVSKSSGKVCLLSETNQIIIRHYWQNLPDSSNSSYEHQFLLQCKSDDYFRQSFWKLQRENQIETSRKSYVSVGKSRS